MARRLRINNLKRSRKINKKDIKRAALSVLKKFGKKNTLIDITLVADGKIRSLNKRYMGRSVPTDVLSFPLAAKNTRGGNGIIGDIYISSDTAYRNARRFNTGFRKEIMLCTVHGVLHLLGFGDKTGREKKRIRKLEEKFLKELWKTRNRSSKRLSRA